MIDEGLLRESLAKTLGGTSFSDLGELHRGKVRDSYRWPGGRRAIVVTDRVSAFDRVIGTVPFKGQVLNGISNFFLRATAHVCPNHLEAVVDPCASVVRECEPFRVELVVRGYLAGRSPTSLWTLYAAGERRPYGHPLPDGLEEHARLDEPLLTPTTKGAVGEKDTPITCAEIVERRLMSAAELATVQDRAMKLFARGQQMARERGLILVDTKYEFGRDASGEVVLIDEAHTPDSSRYWEAATYEEARGHGEAPRALDKEFIRRHLLARGEADDAPTLSDDIRVEAARRYIELYERLTGQAFVPDLSDPEPRIERALRAAY